jgi:hypothetical protein
LLQTTFEALLPYDTCGFVYIQPRIIMDKLSATTWLETTKFNKIKKI